MAPTAAMLMLSHNSKTHNPSVIMQPSSPSATPYFGLKSPVLKMVAKFNPISKEGLDNNQIQTCCVVDHSAIEKKRFEDVLQLCSC
ncbi:hypothetical protein TanjilG_20816 [Lupinus angustifolius]|uniref:Uncharacterized protein n=1 Tax=Lupinus angustifolius TaxID=3871 RepID=A0A4P1QRV3_LUPAN|nr:hypothetical protein TanjilG_20816 [Lupinus angustifolius]